MYYTYILMCSDGSLYTGWTKDVEKRAAQHDAGTGAKYTRSRRPVKLVYSETLSSQSEAMRREHAIKALPRQDKLALIQHFMKIKETKSKLSYML